ncbi:helix-turn-helix domain-containing protein [Dactylosporangium sp. NPDC000521]|uniref:helix-turn-helix domain-containing protein n=1 Tax=Dactylosporangium sp. NPDC000521 TaxID=3363975 RepID=UPI0036A77199
MTSGQVEGAPRTLGEVVRERLKELRKRRKLNPTRTAELYDDPAMSATVLMNIEAGRRQTATTVDELIRLAYVLDVPPEALLVAASGPVQVAPGVVVDPARFLRWMRGQEALEGTDGHHYAAVAAEIPGGGERPLSQQLRAEFLAKATAAFDGFFADSEEIHRKTRKQVHDVLGEVRDAITSGASTQDLLATIDGFLSRLE